MRLQSAFIWSTSICLHRTYRQNCVMISITFFFFFSLREIYTKTVAAAQHWNRHTVNAEVAALHKMWSTCAGWGSANEGHSNHRCSKADVVMKSPRPGGALSLFLSLPMPPVPSLFLSLQSKKILSPLAFLFCSSPRKEIIGILHWSYVRFKTKPVSLNKNPWMRIREKEG